MAFLAANRYWGEDEGWSPSSKSLERLHHLAKQRATERKAVSKQRKRSKRRVEQAEDSELIHSHDDERMEDLSTSVERKQKDRSRPGRERKRERQTVEGRTESTVSMRKRKQSVVEVISESKEQSVESPAKMDQSERRRKRKRQQPASNGVSSGEQSDVKSPVNQSDSPTKEHESQSEGKRKRQKQQQSGNTTEQGKSFDESPLDVESPVNPSKSPTCEATQLPRSDGSQSEEEEEEVSAVNELRGGEDEGQTPQQEGDVLPPVTRGAREKGGGVVHRRLPDWILHPIMVEGDIQAHSHSLDEFGLPGAVVKNLHRMNITQLFPVQVHVIPDLLSSLHGAMLTPTNGITPSDVCVCAPTGCGKTLCYVVPIISALLKRVVCQIRAIIVLPSQELALQVSRVFEQVSHGTGLSIGTVCGHVSMERERAMLLDGYPPGSLVDVLVVTPGRLVEHLRRESFATLRYLRFLVVDEADKLLDQQFQEWLPKLLDAVRAVGGQRGVTMEEVIHAQCGDPLLLSVLHPISREPPPVSAPITTTMPRPPLQKLLFSATMTQNPEHISALELHRPKLFTVATGKESADEISFVLPPQLEEFAVLCSLSHKPLALLHLVMTQQMSRVLCFTNSREATHRLRVLINHFDTVSVSEISSNLTPGQRKSILDKFKKGKIQLLICSDAMARGMDVEHVSCVINYEVPSRFKTYLHRVGRTARAGEKGVAYTLLAREEVHPFNTMLRSVRKKKLSEIKIVPSDLQPLLPQYDRALQTLKDDVTHVENRHS